MVKDWSNGMGNGYGRWKGEDNGGMKRREGGMNGAWEDEVGMGNMESGRQWRDEKEVRGDEWCLER